MKFASLFAGIGLRIALAMGPIACPQSVLATPVTYNFSGVVDSDDADRGYGAFSGAFTFDGAAPDGIADPNTAAYAHSGAPWGVAVSFDGSVTVQFGQVFTMLVSNDLGGADRLGALAQGAQQQTLSIELFDFTQALFSNDALPLPVGGLSMADFGWSTFTWEDGMSTLQGHLTHLTCASGCDGSGNDDGPSPGTVPEPTVAVLSAIALLAAAACRRRIRK
jgi:hypothetical protein